MAHLLVTSGVFEGQRFELRNDTTRVGRRPGNDWVLDAPSVSGTHCEIVRVQQNYLLRDLGSTNGTRLNGERVQEVRLSRNDVVTIGDESFTIVGDDVPEAAGDEMPAMPRTAVMIRPQRVSPNARIVPPPDFRRRFDVRKLWIVIIVLTGLAVVIAAIFFVRSELAAR